MERFLREYFWTAQLAVALIVVLLAAATANNVVAGLIAPWTVAVPEEGQISVDVDSAAKPEQMRPHVPEYTFGRPAEPEEEAEADPCADVTCAEGEVCNPMTGECELDEEEAIDEALSEDGPCVESDIAVNLVGTMVAADPAWSLAILHNPSTSKTQFAMIGDMLLEEAEVTEVRRSRVMLLRDGAIECLRPGDQATRASRSQRRASARRESPRTRSDDRNEPTASTRRRGPIPSSAARAGTASGGSLRDAIDEAGDGEFNIDRSALEQVINNPQQLQAQAPRVVPNYQNGRPNGFRLQGIRSGSIWSDLGLRNGDVIRAVNGTTIDSPQRALELYESLMSQNRVNLVVQRRGQDRSLTYNID